MQEERRGSEREVRCAGFGKKKEKKKQTDGNQPTKFETEKNKKQKKDG